MKLPKIEELENDDERYLYSQDIDLYEQFSTLERVSKIISLVEKYSFGNKILDVGTASGNIATLLAEKGFEAFALDLNKNFLNYAKKKREFGKIIYVHADAMHLPFGANVFDAVILGEIIEHVAYPEKLIVEAKKVLKKGGILIITTPNNHLFLGMLSGNRPEQFKFDGFKERKDLVKKQFGPAGKDHLFVFSLKSLQKLVSQKGVYTLEKGYTNSGLINNLTFPIISFFPKSFLECINKGMVKLPFFKDKFSLGLYLVAKK
jgi:ubiquinone/menaquinone biosynthesis C-methylase UbiE